MKRRRIAACLAAALMLVPLAALAATPKTLYLSGSTTPVASLSTASPPGGALPDYDGSGDSGRLLDKSDKGWLETHSDKYQLFRAPADGIEISGQATLTISVRMKDEDDDKTGVINAYLLDCAGSCTLLATATKTLVPGGPWVQTTLTFPSVSHTFAPGHEIGLKIVVDKNSDDDMDIAYYRSSYPSRLTVQEVVATTTTTATTTTSVATTTTTPTTSSTSGTNPTTSTTSTTVAVGGSPSPGTPTTDPVTGQPTTTVPGETTTTTASETTASTITAAGSGATTTSTVVAQPVSLDTEKSNLVIRTTPSQRGVTIEAASGDISPVEGLMVSFLTAVESIRSQFATSATLGLLMTVLLIVGLSRRRQDD